MAQPQTCELFQMSDPEFVPGFTRRKGAPGYNLEEKRRRTSSKVQLMEMKGDNDLDQVDLDKETVKDEEKEKGGKKKEEEEEE